MTLTEETPSSAPELIVTLVHGTWGQARLPFSRGRLWFEEGSPFVEKLRAAFDMPVHIVPFLWSGANSLEHRADAAARLANILERQNRRSPRAIQVLIGHSHGGTVCTLCLGVLDENIKPLLITLATPFVEIVAIDHIAEAALQKRINRDSILTCLAAIPLASFYEMMRATAPLEADEIRIPTTTFSLLTTLTVLLAMHGPLFYGVAKTAPSAQDNWLTPPARRPSRYSWLTRGGATLKPSQHVLVLRGVDDEAALALSAGSLGTRLSSLFLVVSKPAIRIAAYVGLPVWAVLSFVPQYFSVLEPMRGISSQKIFYLPIVVCISMLIVAPIFSGLFKCFFGRELLLGGFFCDIKSNSSPDAAKMTTVTLPPQAAPGMRHGLYNHPLTVPAIVKFVSIHIEKS